MGTLNEDCLLEHEHTSRKPLWAFAPGKASGRKSTCNISTIFLPLQLLFPGQQVVLAILKLLNTSQFDATGRLQ